MATVAQSLIGTLMGRGWKFADIATYVGRNPSAVRQAFVPKASGYIKPASNLVPALERAVSSGKGPKEGIATLGVANVPRKPGRVREKAQAVGTGEQPAYHITTGGNEDIKRFLREADKRGQKVQLTGDFGNVQGKRKYPKRKRGRPQKVRGVQRKRGEVGILQKGGWEGGKLLDRIEHPEAGDGWKAGDARGAMRELAVKMGDAESVGRFNKVQIFAFNPS